MLTAGEEMVLTFVGLENTRGLVAWACESCELTTQSDDYEVRQNGDNMLVLSFNTTTTVRLHTVSSVNEAIDLMVVSEIFDGHVSLRPAPGEEANHTPVQPCTANHACMVPDRGSLAATTSSPLDASFLLHGWLATTSSEFLVFNASQGDTIEWQWLASSADVEVEFYHQTSTEEVLMDGVFSSGGTVTFSTETSVPAAWWTAPTSGRFVARISSSVAETGWAANAFFHEANTVQSLVGVDLGATTMLTGHDALRAPFDWNEITSLHLNPQVADVHLSVDQLLDGTWVEGTLVTIESGDHFTVYPYPEVTAGRINIENTTVFAVEVHTRSFADLHGLEAPSYTPNAEEDNSTWPVLNLTSATKGNFTLATHDTVDTYRLVVDGWEDSIHFLQFTIEGNISGLEVQLWDVDQLTGETLNTDITRPVNNELKIALQVSRGTHYLQLRHQDPTEVTSHLWGEPVESQPYTIRAAYSLIDEGDEPWYPPSDEAVYWGNIARWFMGLLFLLPVLYLYVHVKRSQRYANDVAAKKHRLAWYTSRLDKGEVDAKTTRLDMAKALQAVAQLPWKDGLDAWGEERIQHRTEDLALAVWQVDPRLATKEDAWPLVIGVHVLNGTWDLAALRFDAPDGAAYEVVHVEPRFLYQGEEVFLDTMAAGHRTYLIVELRGDATSVDVELNGRIENQPMAARIPETLVRDSHDS